MNHFFEDYIHVPEIFWSFETGKPIDRCKLCNCDLMEEGTAYTVEKAFKDGETIFEHALCMNCHTQSISELSTESMERIENYFQTHANLADRQRQCAEQFGTDHEKWIGHCLIKGYPLRECDEYQLYGFCIDQDLIFNGAPYMICGEAIDEIIDLLSSETLGALGELSERLFGIGSPKDLLLL